MADDPSERFEAYKSNSSTLTNDILYFNILMPQTFYAGSICLPGEAIMFFTSETELL
jgi:hypothetical protein